REHVDELRLIHARRVREAEPGQTKLPAELPGLANLIRAVQDFQAEAERLDRATAEVSHRNSLDRHRLAALNDALAQVERAFLLGDGLPGRPWFKHAIYAPGLTTGYAAWPLPAIRQALEDKDAQRLAAAASQAVERIRKATQALETAGDRARALIQAR